VLQHNTEPPEEYGKIYFLGRYDNTILDAKLAKKKFSLWYGQKKYYNCNVEPSPDDTDSTSKFIVQHRMFSITFLELLTNSLINYGNKLNNTQIYLI